MAAFAYKKRQIIWQFTWLRKWLERLGEQTQCGLLESLLFNKASLIFLNTFLAVSPARLIAKQFAFSYSQSDTKGAGKEREPVAQQPLPGATIWGGEGGASPSSFHHWQEIQQEKKRKKRGGGREIKGGSPYSICCVLIDWCIEIVLYQ